MNLLFITHARLVDPPYGDGSTRYRCFNIAEVALEAGHQARVASASSLKAHDLQNVDLISWSRPRASRHLYRLLELANKRNIRCVADVDDLIFDPSLACYSPAVVNRFAPLKSIEKLFANHAQALGLFDAITVSTRYLQQQAELRFPGKPVFTLHNGLSDYWMQHVQSTANQSTHARRIAYLPGTRSHDADLSSISAAILNWLESDTTRQLKIVGKVMLTNRVLPVAQLIRHPWLDYYSLPSGVFECSATIAPLTSSLFNQAKSHVKFIESAAMGIPLIASSIDDITMHTCAGLVLADTTVQWQEALATAGTTEYRAEHSTALQQYAAEHCSARVYTMNLLKAWEANRLVPDEDGFKKLSVAA